MKIVLTSVLLIAAVIAASYFATSSKPAMSFNHFPAAQQPSADPPAPTAAR